MTFKEVASAYREKFSEPVPIYELTDMDTDEMIAFLQKCIKEEKKALELKPNESGMVY